MFSKIGKYCTYLHSCATFVEKVLKFHLKISVLISKSEKIAFTYSVLYKGEPVQWNLLADDIYAIIKHRCRLNFSDVVFAVFLSVST